MAPVQAVELRHYNENRMADRWCPPGMSTVRPVAGAESIAFQDGERSFESPGADEVADFSVCWPRYRIGPVPTFTGNGVPMPSTNDCHRNASRLLNIDDAPDAVVRQAAKPVGSVGGGRLDSLTLGAATGGCEGRCG